MMNIKHGLARADSCRRNPNQRDVHLLQRKWKCLLESEISLKKQEIHRWNMHFLNRNVYFVQRKWESLKGRYISL